MPSRGLPGFLRRSIRPSFDEEDEEAQLPDDGNNNNSDAGYDQDKDKSSKPNDTDQQEVGDSAFEDYGASLNLNDDGECGVEGASSSSMIGRTAPDRLDSNLSTTSSLSASNNLGEDTLRPSFGTENRKASYRETQFDKVMMQNNVVQMAELKKLSWNGIPPANRGMAWKLMLGYLPTNRTRRVQTLERKRAEYRASIAQHYEIPDDSRTIQEQETLRQVLVDVPRTAPEVPLFRNEKVRRALARLLYIWACRHPASSYVQGINDLATPLLAVFLADYYEGEDVLDGNVMLMISDERLDEVRLSFMTL